jgi:hypothetical protein
MLMLLPMIIMIAMPMMTARAVNGRPAPRFRVGRFPCW